MLVMHFQILKQVMRIFYDNSHCKCNSLFSNKSVILSSSDCKFHSLFVFSQNFLQVGHEQALSIILYLSTTIFQREVVITTVLSFQAACPPQAMTIAAGPQY